MRWRRRSRIALGLIAAAIFWTAAGFSFRTYKAARRLTEASTFVAGDPDLRWLMRVPGAEAWASRLAARASPAGRLYGLCGLYVVDSKRYTAALRNLEQEDSAVIIRFGCLASTHRLTNLAADVPQLCASFKLAD